MLGSTQLAGEEVLCYLGKKKKKESKTQKCSSSVVTPQGQDAGFLDRVLPPVYCTKNISIPIYKVSRSETVEKQAESEPADKFCVLDEGLEPLKS